MRIALTIHGGRIAPVFESARRLLVVDVGDAPGSRREVDLAGTTTLERVRRVQEEDADVLVCGGITRSMRHLLEGRGIRVRPWVALDVETALRLVSERLCDPMKIVISAVDGGPDAQVEPRFGRAPWFVVYDTEGDRYDAIANPHVDMPHGAGIQAAQIVLDTKASSIITGRCGPNAYGTLTAGGMTVYSDFEGTVRQAIEAHRAGRLSPADTSNSPGHVRQGAGLQGGSGVGRGRGRGGGGGGGGQGRGRGRGGARGRGQGGGGGGQRGGR